MPPAPIPAARFRPGSTALPPTRLFRCSALAAWRLSPPCTHPPAILALMVMTSGFEERYAARELLQRALRHLSEQDAACLVLHYVAGERYGEVALRLGLTGEAVRKRVSRGLRALGAASAALDPEAGR